MLFQSADQSFPPDQWVQRARRREKRTDLLSDSCRRLRRGLPLFLLLENRSQDFNRCILGVIIGAACQAQLIGNDIWAASVEVSLGENHVRAPALVEQIYRCLRSNSLNGCAQHFPEG